MNKLLFAVLFFCFTKVNAQLSGSAFLSGQTDHSGIKVKFIAASATAITDSAITNSSGAYSINISGGIYFIVFSKVGYQSAYYNNNASMVLTNTVVLSNVNLVPGNIVNVSGSVSGTWLSTNIYVVNSNIDIPLASVLTIQPGTVIKFNGNYSLTANGQLNAIGSSSNKIIFTSNSNAPASGNWLGITVNSSNSSIKNCFIEYCSNAIWISNSSPLVEGNEITKFSGDGIVLNMSASSIIKDNIIHDFTNSDNSGGGGISSYGSIATIECNTIYNGAGYGIVAGDQSSIKNNLIYNIGIVSPHEGTGIDCYAFSKGVVQNNIIHHCNLGINYGETVNTGLSTLIVNNTIASCTTGISSHGYYGNPAIIGNIIANNTNGIFQGPTWGLTPTEISNNLLWNNPGGNFTYIPINGLGQIVNTNTNGDPVDSYLNVFMDPLFTNNTPPYYSTSSPCINAGSTKYSQNIGCDPNLMCTGMVLGVKQPKNNVKAGLFPNPFINALTLTGVDAGKISAIKFYDITGKMFEAEVGLDSASSLNIRANGLIAGVYILEITFSNSTKEYLRVIKE